VADRDEIALQVNGTERRVPAGWADETLLDTLREQLGLVGAKYGCGIGVCGACKVQLDGAPVNACRVRTADASGRSIVTIEGLAEGGLHRLQRAWIEERVPQCGYCQPGQLMQASALLASNPDPSDDEIRAAMAGNLCRCGTYERIRRAIRRAAREADVAETPPRG
jgi:aerobic-type carbon monoxide dehydrogenase small subunit (CoxS/CutS family)